MSCAAVSFSRCGSRFAPKGRLKNPYSPFRTRILRDLTLNTFKPSPAEETSDGTFYRMEFDALEAGDAFEVMIDGQVNPDLFGGTRGRIELLDGDTRLAAMPLKLEVRP